ncbi:hypothetical protein V9T40_001550 [Parthenolecanium corni]|uniref:Cytochrome P450 n=1 Tax=Parthenolecanium corni TaxID=536013 RepID=A0AAN9TKX8_9HEMI
MMTSPSAVPMFYLDIMTSSFFFNSSSKSEKVHEELNAVFFEDKDRPAETSDLAKLTFLEQCIKESLRKSSVIPFVERYVTTDVTMKGMYYS